MNDPTVVEGTMVRRLKDFAEGRDLDTGPLLKQAGVDPSKLDVRGQLIPFPDAMRFYDLVANALGDRLLGLDLASVVRPSDYGILGLLWSQRPRVDEAFEMLARDYSLFLHSAELRHSRDPDETVLTSWFQYEHPGTDVFRIELLATFQRFANFRCPTITPAREVAFALPDPGEPERFLQAFGVLPQWEAEVDRLVLDTALLDRVMPDADAILLAHLQEAVLTHLALRREAAGDRARMIRLTDCVVDLAAGMVARGDERVRLTTKERAMLEYFSKRANEVVTHDDLERDVWGIGKTVISHAPAVAIRRLRQKIEPPDAKKPVNLVTVFGEGWRLVVPSADTHDDAS